MSYITFNPNQTVYVKGIGYGNLINCGNLKFISQKVSIPLINEKKQSIYFDPELFNSDGDSNNSKKSHSKSDEQKDKKIVEVIVEKNSEVTEKKQSKREIEKEKENEAEYINIVQVKLDNSNVVVHTLDSNLTKIIDVVVKPFLATKRDQIVIEIQITKTIDTLRKLIFQQLGEPMANYYNIKIFTTTPTLNELNVHSKTISQCLIKSCSKLILTADYAFSFKEIPANAHPKYKISLSNNGNTLISNMPQLIVEEAKKVEPNLIIQLPPPPPLPEGNPLPKEPIKVNNQINLAVQLKVQSKQAQTKAQKVQKMPQKVQKVQKVPEKQQQKQMMNIEQSIPYNVRCQIELQSGKKYWQVKLEKMPSDEQDLLIGIGVISAKRSENKTSLYDYIWGYYPVGGKKVFIERDKETQVMEEEVEPYGYSCKVNDSVGVLLSIKDRRAKLTFYRSNISCGQAYSIDLTTIKNHQNVCFVPIVNIAGEAQITLDSRAQFPLDSYRI